MADFAAARRARRLGLADAERREVVVEHELLAVLVLEPLDALLVNRGAERAGDERLGFAAREERRAVRAGQHADLAVNLAQVLQAAAVLALAGHDEHAAGLAFEPVAEVLDLRGGRAFGLGLLGDDLLEDGVHRALPGELAADLVRGHEAVEVLRLELGEERRLGLRRRRRLADAHRLGEFLLDAHDLADRPLAGEDRLEEVLLGDLAPLAFQHRDGALGAGDDQFERALLHLFVRGVDDEFVLDLGDADRAGGAEERDGSARSSAPRRRRSC